ncbi:hypothetical protein CYMTET_6287 [Cymbomonas tetramitiformis]|uniref:Uncharacterized protein n=1 Tax=Cymbomonas tetramitiformis TaxID=36881 RepID=A0AAE0KTT4_9CHLO|nr:hypothetical protein CYMTET_30563 [Cymbomonas tetramitiformis]KAK3286142.1 hypothetical protein CYMTET_6287 [Cymbomonas tetramitiformis]
MAFLATPVMNSQTMLCGQRLQLSSSTSSQARTSTVTQGFFGPFKKDEETTKTTKGRKAPAKKAPAKKTVRGSKKVEEKKGFSFDALLPGRKVDGKRNNW